MDPDLVQLIVALSITGFLMLMGMTFGKAAERRHLRLLDERERELAGIGVTQIKTFPGRAPGAPPPTLVVAEVVIASDYLKTWLSGIRNFFGGEMKSFQTLLTRARREATLQLLELAKENGYNAVCNIRLDMADIGSMSKMPMAAIIASGTAYHTSTSSRAEP